MASASHACVRHKTHHNSQASRFHPVSHVIFDLDGTLLNTEVVYHKVYMKLLAQHGKQLTPDVLYRMKGATASIGYLIMIKTYELPYTVQELHAKVMEMALDDFENCGLMPGVRELICHLHQHCIPMAIATSSSAEVVAIKTRKNNQQMLDLMHHVVCADSDREVKNSKPAPDIYLVAAGRFDEQPRPECCLVIEDAPNGIQAARAAGMQVVMIPDPNTPVGLTRGATVVLRSLKDFRPEMFGLPPFHR